MVQAILFTDDEVLAIAAMIGKAWPIGLPTVASAQEHVFAAAQRGVRSLSVRGMLATGPDGTGFAVDAAISTPVDAVASATTRVGAYIAPASDPMQLGGALITAVPAVEGWWLDAVTPQGVHGFSQVTGEFILAGIEEMAAIGANLLPPGQDPSAYVCVVRHGIEPDEFSVAAPGPDGTQWDRAAVIDALERRLTP